MVERLSRIEPAGNIDVERVSIDIRDETGQRRSVDEVTVGVGESVRGHIVARNSSGDSGVTRIRWRWVDDEGNVLRFEEERVVLAGNAAEIFHDTRSFGSPGVFFLEGSSNFESQGVQDRAEITVEGFDPDRVFVASCPSLSVSELRSGASATARVAVTNGNERAARYTVVVRAGGDELGRRTRTVGGGATDAVDVSITAPAVDALTSVVPQPVVVDVEPA